MNRDEWKFAYTADKLHDAASAKLAHHKDRLVWWETKKAETKAKVQAEGVEIDESVSNMLSNSYRQETVSIRRDLLTDMQECVGKVVEHRGKVEDYGAWVQVLASQGQSTLMLTRDDWLYFFGR